MLLRRLFIEIEHDQRWVTFRQEGADAQLSGFRLDDAFDTSDVVAAACATGWVVQREGKCWVSDSVDCEVLGDLVNEMLFYFLRSGEPRPELVRLRDRIKRYWNGCRPPLCLWASACLDLAARERVAAAARQVDDLWEQPVLQLEVDTHLRACVVELALRYTTISGAAEDLVGARKMAPSRRTRGRQQLSEKEVG